MILEKTQEVNEGREQSIGFFLAETNELNPVEPATELGICIINGSEQIDFGFSQSETDQLIGFLKGLRKNIIQREKVKTA